ncbi:MAG: EamA family transporter [Elusimicrobiota bacterium]
MLLILTAILWGAPPAIEKTALKTTNALTGLAIRNIAITVVLLIIVTFQGNWSDIAGTPSREKLLFGISGICAGLLGMFTYYMALKITPVSKAVPITASYPLVAVILGALFLGENVGWQRVVGTVFIIAGVWLVR